MGCLWFDHGITDDFTVVVYKGGVLGGHLRRLEGPGKGMGLRGSPGCDRGCAEESSEELFEGVEPHHDVEVELTEVPSDYQIHDVGSVCMIYIAWVGYAWITGQIS